MPDELKAEWLDAVAHIESIDDELRELAVRKQGQSMYAHTLRVRRARLLQIKQEWDNLIRESQS